MKLLAKRGIRVFKRGRDEYAVLDEKTGAFARTNETGLIILQKLDGKNTVEDVVSQISADFSIPNDMIYSQVNEFIEKGRRLGLVAPFKRAEVPEFVNFWIHVTNKCNLRCSYCYFKSAPECKEELSIEKINELLRDIKELGKSVVYITGGEPLLHKDLFKLETDGLFLRLITNGTLISEENVPKIGKIFTEVQVSLDGSNASVHDKLRGTGSFDKTMKGLKILAEQPIERKFISATITKQNFDQASGLLELANELGFNLFFVRGLPLGRCQTNLCLTHSEYDELVENSTRRYQQMQNENWAKRGFFFWSHELPYLRLLGINKGIQNCGLGRTTISIDSQGAVYPCALLHKPGLVLGNIHEESFFSIYERAKQTYDIDVTYKIKKCRDCYVRRLCGGGCRALSLLEKGDLWALDPTCAKLKSDIEKILFL